MSFFRWRIALQGCFLFLLQRMLWVGVQGFPNVQGVAGIIWESVRSKKLQNESSRRRRPQKIHQKSPPFFNEKFPGKFEDKIHKSCLESGQSLKGPIFEKKSISLDIFNLPWRFRNLAWNVQSWPSEFPTKNWVWWVARLKFSIAFEVFNPWGRSLDGRKRAF